MMMIVMFLLLFIGLTDDYDLGVGVKIRKDEGLYQKHEERRW